jgi:hypothetical protein
VRDGATVLVEQGDPVAGQGIADGDRLPGLQLRHGAGDGRLGRAVRVEDAAAGAPPVDQFPGARLPADVHGVDERERPVERGQHRRDAVDHRDPLLLEEVGQPRADPPPVRRAGDERGPDRPGRPDLLDGEVEGDGHALIDAVGRPHAVEPGNDVDEVADAGLGDLDALGPPAGSRRVDDVADGVADGFDRRTPTRPSRQLAGEFVETDGRAREARRGCREIRGGDHQTEV